MQHNLVPIAIAAALVLPAAAKDYAGKSVYLPEELADNDFSDPASKWSFSRMAATDNIVLFWAPGFGGNIGDAPQLDGNNMNVDMANLLDRLEEFYDVFRNDMKFVKPGTKADRYKMMVMLDYSLEGTAYGGAYDDEIGALWITPNRVQDKRLNCIAHELGHSFQTQISCDGEGVGWGGAGFYEMASQWMLWQVNPDWQTDENYHLNAYRDLTYKAFLHIDNIYHSPYVLEAWGERHGLPFIAELFRQGQIGEDPAMTYKRLTGLDQNAFCDTMFTDQRRQINWDFDRIRTNAAPYANLWHTELLPAGKGKWRPNPGNCPENYGFNAIALQVPGTGKKVTVDFDGLVSGKSQPGLDADGYYLYNPAKAGWRYGFVAVTSDGRTLYSDVGSSPHGRLSYAVPSGTKLSHLWLVVMGAPTEHWCNIDGPDNPGDAQWPYAVAFSGTEPIQ